MACSSHVLVIFALFIYLYSAEDVVFNPAETSLKGGSITSRESGISGSNTTIDNSSTTAEPDGTTTPSDPTNPTTSLTTEPTETTTPSDPTNPTSSVATEPTETTTPSDPTSSTDPATTQSTEAPSGSEATTAAESGTSNSVSTSLPSESAHTGGSAPPTTPEPIKTTTSSEIPASTDPTITQTVKTTPTVTTAKPLECQNGGTYDGSICICPSGISGNLCQDFAFTPETFNQSVVVAVVIDEEYKDKYDNTNSTEYKEFVKKFTDNMNKYYSEKKIPNFQEVVVTNVSRASSTVRLSLEARTIYTRTGGKGVSVAHDVVLKIVNSNSGNAYNSSLENIKTAVNGLVDCKDCVYNVKETPNVDRTELDMDSVCKNNMKDSGIVEYYRGVKDNDKMICVTQCDEKYKVHGDVKRCKNKGSCKVFSGLGPTCRCQNVDSNWYIGSDCSMPIQKTAFFAGLSVTLAVLFVMIGALMANTFISKHKQTKKKDMKKKQVNEWLDEDYEWSRSNTPVNGLKGNFINPVFTEKYSANYNGGFFQQAPPPFDTFDRTFTNPGYSHSPTNVNNLPMRIIRPQVRTSWDI
ncbi:mucin-3A isoform X3 [Kryptolebias marmoratus]|uniref:mucin-3A isoform X3 n=1 Tax=Kryptolebias marmoratus TaxID=37003 RepID=UPI0007F91F0E|nr:mucin-3A isoform X3 [Kryptolebias marmoratus]